MLSVKRGVVSLISILQALLLLFTAPVQAEILYGVVSQGSDDA